MKQKILSLFILSIISTMTLAMEAPNAEKKESTVSSKDFIKYINDLTKDSDPHDFGLRVICRTLKFSAEIGNHEIFKHALKRWKKFPEENCFHSGKLDSDLIEPLLIAASQGKCDFLETIIKQTKGTIIDDAPPSHVCTALGYAAGNGHCNAVKLLLAHNANPQRYNSDTKKNKKIPLELAIERGRTLCVRELLTNSTRKAEPNISVHDKSFASLLHWALSLGNQNESVKELLAHGAYVNYMSPDLQLQQQGTPLMIAIDYANKGGVEILLEVPEVIFRHSVNGMTPREFAEHKAEIEWNDQKKIVRMEIIELLKKAEAAVTPGA